MSALLRFLLLRSLYFNTSHVMRFHSIDVISVQKVLRLLLEDKLSRGDAPSQNV